MIDKLMKQPIDAEQIGLLHEIHETATPGHTCRGYAILGTKLKPILMSKEQLFTKFVMNVYKVTRRKNVVCLSICTSVSPKRLNRFW